MLFHISLGNYLEREDETLAALDERVAELVLGHHCEGRVRPGRRDRRERVHLVWRLGLRVEGGGLRVQD